MIDNTSCLFVSGSSGSRYKVLVSFAGKATKYGGIRRFELKRTLDRIFPEWDKYFLVDLESAWYQRGLSGLTHDIPSTASLLAQYLEGYQYIAMVGISAGGYAAILFGSLLGADKVVAFQPQTIISCRKYGRRYNNLRRHVNDKTHYLLFGDSSVADPSDPHHISHCYNIAAPNVEIREMQGINLRELRDSGELDRILIEAI